MITATYVKGLQTYIVSIDALTAHRLIWGGVQTEVNKATSELRSALVEAEDKQMTDEDYVLLIEPNI